MELMKLNIQKFSGGSYDYVCYKIEEQCVGRMCDKELDDLMKDISKLCHELEWWQSSDSCEEDYRKEVKYFKKKWFNGDRTDRLKNIIDEQLEKTKKSLYQTIGIEE